MFDYTTPAPCAQASSKSCVKRLRLPIGIQTFAKIREDDAYYVDKTGFALDMVERGSHYFLSPPHGALAKAC